jgi:hypothetical protein
MCTLTDALLFNLLIVEDLLPAVSSRDPFGRSVPSARRTTELSLVRVDQCGSLRPALLNDSNR